MAFFQQFNGDWARSHDVGIEELYGLEYSEITDTTVRAVADLLGPALCQAVRGGGLSKDEEKLVTPCSTLFNSPTLLSKYVCDLKLYMEACVASSRSGRQIEFLVTDDHHFFRGFCYSCVAESVLLKEVMAVMDIHKWVQVKLAAEVIKGV